MTQPDSRTRIRPAAVACGHPRGRRDAPAGASTSTRSTGRAASLRRRPHAGLHVCRAGRRIGPHRAAQNGRRLARLWTASVHDAPAPPAIANVIVERSFPAPETFERLKAIVDAKAWCLEQHRVNWARSFLSTDGRRMLCFYAAPDAESVRLAQREAGLPVDTVGDSNGSVRRRCPVRPDAPGHGQPQKRRRRKFHELSHAESHVRGRSLRPRPVIDRFHST